MMSVIILPGFLYICDACGIASPFMCVCVCLCSYSCALCSVMSSSNFYGLIIVLSSQASYILPCFCGQLQEAYVYFIFETCDSKPQRR